MRVADEETLSAIPGVGPERAKAIKNELAIQSDFIDELLDAVEIVSEDSTGSQLPTVCFTGKMPEKRSFYEELAKNKGFQAVDSVSKELSLLVAADLASGSSKLTKAAKLGIRVVKLDEFLTMENISGGSMVSPVEKTVAPDIGQVGKAAEISLFSDADFAEDNSGKNSENTEENSKPEQLSFGF